MLPAPELAAIVIGELLRSYREETGEQPRAAVIAVPAKLDQGACNGLRTAARLARLSYSPLIQEPIAAALGFGLRSTDERACWMAFNLDGGTLDVSLVMVRNGQLSLPEEGHAVDTRLGGSNFVRELMIFAVAELTQRFALSKFAEKPTYANLRGHLLWACEEAETRLSKRRETVIEIDGALCQDERGIPVKVEIPINRSQYEGLIAVDVERMVHVCQLLLVKNCLTTRDVDRLVLIGEATRTPYLRQVLAERLGIQIDVSADPVTAVALGAALHAEALSIADAVQVGVRVKQQIRRLRPFLRGEAILAFEEIERDFHSCDRDDIEEILRVLRSLDRFTKRMSPASGAGLEAEFGRDEP
jgi:molecular chaperone DnaK